MTKNVDLFLEAEMYHDDTMAIQLENGTFNDSVDQSVGIDPVTGEIDEDAGMMFPQPFHEINF